MDWQRAAGQGDAKAHSKTHRGAFGAPRRRMGAPGAVGFAALSPRLGQPRAANPRVVSGAARAEKVVSMCGPFATCQLLVPGYTHTRADASLPLPVQM